MKKKTKKSSPKKINSTVILILVLLAGVSLLLYPTVSDWWNSFHQSQAIADYTKHVAEIDDDEYERILTNAKQYNQRLFDKGISFSPLSEEERKIYEQTLDVSGTGIMGYVDIPSIRCSLPIYHGTNEGILQIGIGHLEWSSLPVGGSSTHCVISGHRGLPSAKLFTDLDKMVVGDVFFINVLNETLAYEVDQIRIVLPQELDELTLEEGKDYCTLVTCTPYGVNSHRLLVRGVRTSKQNDVRIIADARQIETTLVALAIAVPILLLLTIAVLVYTKKKKKH